MGSSLGVLTLDLVAKIGGFTGPLDKAERASKKSADGISKHNKKIADSFLSITAIAGTSAAVIAFAKSSLTAADAIGKVAATAGVTTDTLQEMRHAASLNGVTFEDLDQGMQQFNKRIGELKAGTGALYTYLLKTDRALISQVKSAKSTDEALDLIYGSMKNITTSSERSALAVAAFGRSGQRLSILTDTYEELRKEARDLGLVIDGDLIKNAEIANDKMDTMSRIIKTQLTSAFISLAPTIIAVSQAALDASNAIGKFFRSDKSDNISDAERLNSDLIALKQALKDAERTGSDTFVSITSDGQYLTHTIGSARAEINMMEQDIKRLGETEKTEGISTSQQSIEMYKKAFSGLDQITKQTYDILKKEYEKDRDEFIETTGDKVTAQAIYNKNIEALNKKLTGSDNSWSDFGKVLEETSKANKQRLEIITSSNAAIAAENDRRLQDDIARDASYQQILYDIKMAEIDNIEDEAEREIAIHEYKFERLKELYNEGSKELTAIEKLQAEERKKLIKDTVALHQKGDIAALSSAQKMFDGIMDATYAFGGEQTAFYKALFLMKKGIALAESIMAIATGLAESSKVGWPQNIITMAGHIATTAGIIGEIAAVSFSGAKDSGGYIPSGKWGIAEEVGPEIVRGPAMVTSRNRTAQMFDEMSSRKSSGMTLNFNITVTGNFVGNNAAMRDLAKEITKHTNRELTRVGAVI